MAGKEATAKKAEEKKEEAKQAADESKKFEDLGKKYAEVFDLGKLKNALADMLRDLGYAKEEITPEVIFKAFQAMPTEQRDKFLREHGLVPTPGFFSSITGWHNIEHLRSRGWQNKVQGVMGLTYQLAALGLAAYMGIDWYRSRSA